MSAVGFWIGRDVTISQEYIFGPRPFRTSSTARQTEHGQPATNPISTWAGYIKARADARYRTDFEPQSGGAMSLPGMLVQDMSADTWSRHPSFRTGCVTTSRDSIASNSVKPRPWYVVPKKKKTHHIIVTRNVSPNVASWNSQLTIGFDCLF